MQYTVVHKIISFSTSYPKEMSNFVEYFSLSYCYVALELLIEQFFPADFISSGHEVDLEVLQRSGTPPLRSYVGREVLLRMP
jgi:hypothetical protein